MVNTVKTLTSKDQLTADIGSHPNTLFVLDFSATWCGPCKRIAPKFAQLAQETQHANFYKIDVDEPGVSDLVNELRVESLPTFIFMRGGKILKRFSGANEAELYSTVGSLA